MLFYKEQSLILHIIKVIVSQTFKLYGKNKKSLGIKFYN